MVQKTAVSTQLGDALNVGKRWPDLGVMARQGLCLIASATLLLGGCCLLLLTLISASPGAISTIMVVTGGTVMILGLFYLVDNTRRLILREPGRLFFGTGEEVDALSSQERAALVRSADEAYSYRKTQTQPSLISTFASLLTLRGVILMGAGALVAYGIVHTASWWILAGAGFGLLVQYPVLVFYDFFCSDLERYAFRSEFARAYLQDHQSLTRSGESLSVSGPELKPFSFVMDFWHRSSLRFPIVSGLAILTLGRAQAVFWGFVVTLAVAPLVGINMAGMSTAEPLIRLFGEIGSATGFEWSLRLMTILNVWNLPNIIGDLMLLCTVTYLLGLLSVSHLIGKYGPRAFASVIIGFATAPVAFLCSLIYPFAWALSLGSLKYEDFTAILGYNANRFWSDLFHLYIIAAVIGVTLKAIELLAPLTWSSLPG